MKKVATIILNRNLPDVTNSLVEHIYQYDGSFTDIFVVEAGSDSDKVSKYMTWNADWADAKAHGLRYSRGMNFGLSQLYKEGKFQTYDAFFLLTNDTLLEKTNSLEKLINVMSDHKRVGILSPCSKNWGEYMLLEKNKTKYFWYIHNNAYLLRKEFIESVCNFNEINHQNFLFDGSNFRGYGADSELIAKAYINDWSAAITAEVIASEDESHLLNKSDLIKTESYDENLKLFIEEGKVWMKNKYGFNSRWSFQQYIKSFYDSFFEFYPELKKYKV